MRRTLSLCLLALVASAAGAPAQTNDATTGAYVSTKAATLKIDGTSTMHDYSLSTSTLKVTSAMVRGAALLDPGALQTFEMQIPVNSFTTDKDGLKKKMLEAMKADKYPAIAFRMTSYTLEPAAAGSRAAVKGTLTVAGVEQPIDLALDLSEAADGIRVKGAHALSMKDFGIKPPTMFMGMLKTDEKITISFELHLTPAATASN